MATTLDIPEALHERLAEIATLRGTTPDRLATDVLTDLFGTAEGDGVDPLAAFIGSVETNDPDWASTDTALLRKEAASRRGD